MSFRLVPEKEAERRFAPRKPQKQGALPGRKIRSICTIFLFIFALVRSGAAAEDPDSKDDAGKQGEGCGKNSRTGSREWGQFSEEDQDRKPDCKEDPCGPCRAEQPLSPAEDIAPAISDFVLYAERSVRLGDCDTVCGGEVGVRSTGESKMGPQLKVGSGSHIQRKYSVFSPSVSLERNVIIGIVHAGELYDNGVKLGTTEAFPAAAMPPIPLVAPCFSSERNVSAGADQVLVLLPGKYGALTVDGTALLNPGDYEFSSVSLADAAQ